MIVISLLYFLLHGHLWINIHPCWKALVILLWIILP